MIRSESALARSYRRLYELSCGTHPFLRPWHFQWGANLNLYRDLRRILPRLRGTVLDVGCGKRPYQGWLASGTKYIGIDAGSGARSDFVVDFNREWPLRQGSADAILCTQVLQAAPSLDLLVSEIKRVLRPGGTLIISFPFLYNELLPNPDFRRLTILGVEELFSGYQVIERRRQGGFGSTMALLSLNWIDKLSATWFVTRLLKAALLPVWMVLSFVLNIAGQLVDRIDPTRAFYSNGLLVLRKPDNQ